MPKTLTDRVREVLADYDETLQPINELTKKHGMSWTSFRKTLDKDPELQSEYERIQHWRGERYSEQAIVVGTGLDIPKEFVRAHEVAAQVYERAASRYNKRFNPRITVEHEVGPNILGAMAEAALRLPPRDLGNIIDVKPLQICDAATDTQSGASPGSDDPFAD